MSAGAKWVGMWFLAVCVPVSIPFAILAGVGILSSCVGLFLMAEAPYLPLFERLTGLGQLLPTGLALLYAGSKDAHSAEGPARSSPKGKAIHAGTWTFGILVGAFFTLVQYAVLQKQGAVPYDTQHQIAWISLGLFAVCAWIAFWNVYLSTPVPAPAPAPSDRTVAA